MVKLNLPKVPEPKGTTAPTPAVEPVLPAGAPVEVPGITTENAPSRTPDEFTPTPKPGKSDDGVTQKK